MTTKNVGIITSRTAFSVSSRWPSSSLSPTTNAQGICSISRGRWYCSGSSSCSSFWLLVRRRSRRGTTTAFSSWWLLWRGSILEPTTTRLLLHPRTCYYHDRPIVSNDHLNLHDTIRRQQRQQRRPDNNRFSYFSSTSSSSNNDNSNNNNDHDEKTTTTMKPVPATSIINNEESTMTSSSSSQQQQQQQEQPRLEQQPQVSNDTNSSSLRADQKIIVGSNGTRNTSSSLRHSQQQLLLLLPTAVPGVALAAATALSGFVVAATISTATHVPISGIPVAIVLGMTVRTVATSLVLFQSSQQPPSPPNNNNSNSNNSTLVLFFQPGLSMAAKTILQGGIVCVGIKLSVWQLVSASSTSVPVVLAAVTAGMVGIPRIAAWLKLDSSSSSSSSTHLVPLMTAGTSICGVTAISALAPAIRAPPADVAVAVANTVLFGTIGMLFYPYLLHNMVVGAVPPLDIPMMGMSSSSLHHSSTVVGLTLGVAIHDTSQVLGAALSYKESYGDAAAMELAAVTKLVRNLGLAAAIPYLTYQHHIKQQQSTSTSTSGAKDHNNNSHPIRAETLSGLPTFTSIVPPFLVAFLAMSVLRSVGDVTLGTPTVHPDTAALYQTTVDWIGNDLSKYALGTAMAATGLSIDAHSLRTVGWRPFALGGLSALLVGGVGCYAAHAVSYITTNVP